MHWYLLLFFVCEASGDTVVVTAANSTAGYRGAENFGQKLRGIY